MISFEKYAATKQDRNMMCFGNPVALPLIPFPSSEIEGQEQYVAKSNR